MEEYKITLCRDDKLLIITTPLSFYKVDDNTRKYQDMKLASIVPYRLLD